MAIRPTVIVTGAGKGLGKHTAILAAKHNYDLALISRTSSDLGEVAELCQDISPEVYCTSHLADLAEADAVKDVFTSICEQHEKLYGLVNNAGTWTGGTSVVDLSAEELKRSLDLNFWSAFYCVRQFLDQRNNEDICIINIGATSSLRGGENVFPFSAAKMMLRGLSQSLAKESGRDGVHVAHLIIDGMLDNERTLKLNPEIKTERFLSCEQVARTIVNVLNEDRGSWTFEWDVRSPHAKW